MNLKELLFNNFWYKLFSVIFGILLWFMVIGQQNSELTIELPLEFKNLPSNYMITKSVVHKVSALISGPSTLLKLIAKKEISFPVDLAHVHKGKNEIVLYPELLNMPHKVTVRIITPSTISVYTDRIVEEIKPVLPEYEGEVPKGFEIKNVKIEPSIVKITGAEDEIKKLDYLKTDVINLNGKMKSFEVEKTVITSLKYLKSIVPNKVKVTITIGEKLIEKNLYKIPVKVKSTLDLTNYKIKISPKTVNIKYQISENFKNIIKKGDFEVYIEVDDIHKTDFPVKISFPDHVKILNVSSKNINVIFEEIKKSKKRKGR